jgi:two-component system CheB/CheR fusion protein
MQSINEELVTVNAELQQKIESLSHSNNDMNNLLAGTGIGTLFLDPQLRIVRFTPALKAIINLVQTDIGRPVGDFAANLSGSDRIAADVKAVLDTLVPHEAQVQTRDGVWYLMRILPYRTVDNVIEGAVITFVDVTELRRLQDSLRRSEQWLRMALSVSGIRGWTYDLASGRVSHPLPGGADGKDFPTLDAFSSAIHPDDRDRVRATMEAAISSGTEFRAEFRVVEKGGDRWLLSRGTVWRDAQGRPTALVGIDVDITESKLGGG